MQFTLARLSWAGQAGAALTLSAACAICFHLFWAAPARAHLVAQERALATMRRDVARAAIAERTLPQAQRLMAALTARLSAMGGTVPGAAGAPAVLRDGQALAEESGLWVTGFKPLPAVVREPVTEWSVALEFDGTYAGVIGFLQRVADDPRLIVVSDMRLRASERPADESTLTGGCRLTTVVPRDVHPATTGTTVGSSREVRRSAGDDPAAAVGLP